MPFYNSFLQHFFLKGQAWKNIIWHGLLKKKEKKLLQTTSSGNLGPNM